MAVYLSGGGLFVEPNSEEALAFLTRELLDRGADPIATPTTHLTLDFVAMFGRSALHLAAAYGQRAALQVMLDDGAPVESCVNQIPSSHNDGFPGGTPVTPLGCAMLPPQSSLAYNDPRVYLGTIIFLLERGASFRNSLTHRRENNFRGWLFPLFTARFGGVPWYNLDNFDLFERAIELVAKDLDQERLPIECLAELMKMAITCETSNGNFCKWYVQGIPSSLLCGIWLTHGGPRLAQHYGVVLTDFDLAQVSPADLIHTARYYLGVVGGPPAGPMNSTLYKLGMMDISNSYWHIPRYHPGMIDFLLDHIQDTSTISKLHGNSSHSTVLSLLRRW